MAKDQRGKMSENTGVYGRQSIKNIWFVGLKAVLDYFSECVKLGEQGV